MPWKETWIVDQRMQFIVANQQDPRGNFSRICQQFGISRTVGYRWIKRYEEGGASALESRAPIAQSHPNQTPDEIMARVIGLRKEHPHEGPKKIRARLESAGLAAPAQSTIGDILKKHGLVRPRKTRMRVPPHPDPLTVAEAPNDVWCMDFKGNFVVGDRTRCYPLTITDNFSRYLLRCEALTDPTEAEAHRVCDGVFNEFGLPTTIRSDNGTPFASKAIAGLSKLSIYWIQLGILPERIEPGEPQQNGRHERMHRTLKQHCITPPKESIQAQQLAFDRFCASYNDDRPHESLNQTPPAKHYQPSRKPKPGRISPLEYAKDMDVRIISYGALKMRGSKLFLSRLLDGLRVGLKEVDDDAWELHFGPLLLGHVFHRDEELRFYPNVG